MRSGLYRLRIAHDVAALIRSLHPQIKKKIKASLEVIISDPGSGKPLKDELEGLNSFRVGKLRIVYRVSEKEVQVVAVGPRRYIYEATYRLVTKGPK